MKSNRRKFLKLAAVSALGLGAGRIGFLGDAPAGAMDIPTAADYNAPMEAKHWGMAIDTTRFNQELVDVCATACHTQHNVPTIPGKKGIKWFWGGNFEETFPTEHGHYLAEDVEHRVYPLLCNQCEDPMCVRVCPTQATFKRADGIVMMDFHRCIGCRYCMAGCPYGARSFNWQDPRPHIQTELNMSFPTRERGVVEKCNFCTERLEVGLLPACVEACKVGGLIFGDIEDPNSNVRKVLAERFTMRRKPELGTQPNVYYIV